MWYTPCSITNTSRRLAHFTYGVATISRLLKDIGLFCERALLKSLYSAKKYTSQRVADFTTQLDDFVFDHRPTFEN